MYLVPIVAKYMLENSNVGIQVNVLIAPIIILLSQKWMLF